MQTLQQVVIPVFSMCHEAALAFRFLLSAAGSKLLLRGMSLVPPQGPADGPPRMGSWSSCTVEQTPSCRGGAARAPCPSGQSSPLSRSLHEGRDKGVSSKGFRTAEQRQRGRRRPGLVCDPSWGTNMSPTGSFTSPTCREGCPPPSRPPSCFGVS